MFFYFFIHVFIYTINKYWKICIQMLELSVIFYFVLFLVTHCNYSFDYQLFVYKLQYANILCIYLQREKVLENMYSDICNILFYSIFGDLL